MGISLLRATGRLLAPVVGIALLAGVSTESAADFEDQPRIRLQLGEGSVDPSLTSGGINRIIFEEPGEGLPIAEQTFKFDKGPLKCTVMELLGDQLVSLGAFPTLVGMGPDSMGVYNGASGVSCYRMTANVDNTGKNEAITITLGTAANPTIAGVGEMSNYAFNRLELDMEVKGNAVFELQLFSGATPGEKYTLYSGRSIDEATVPLTTGESSPSAKNFQCGAGDSDSNQDSGPNDNCRWIINDLGTKFTLRAIAGEGSLEGGGDWGGDYGGPESAFANNTIIYLVSLSEEGTLTCDDTCDESTGVCYDDLTGQVGDGQSFARCSVTRLANVGTSGDTGGVCFKPFPYKLSTELSADACNLDQKAPQDFANQFAAAVKIKFPPEPRKDLDEVGLRTTVQFACDSGSNAPISGVCTAGLTPKFTPERCKGTVVRDANNNKTIAEVLGPDDVYDSAVDGRVDHDNDPTTPPVNIVVDQTTSAPLDWACVLETTIEYVGDNQMQRLDTVLFWGDARFSTQ